MPRPQTNQSHTSTHLVVRVLRGGGGRTQHQWWIVAGFDPAAPARYRLSDSDTQLTGGIRPKDIIVCLLQIMI